VPDYLDLLNSLTRGENLAGLGAGWAQAGNPAQQAGGLLQFGTGSQAPGLLQFGTHSQAPGLLQFGVGGGEGGLMQFGLGSGAGGGLAQFPTGDTGGGLTQYGSDSRGGLSQYLTSDKGGLIDFTGGRAITGDIYEEAKRKSVENQKKIAAQRTGTQGAWSGPPLR